MILRNKVILIVVCLILIGGIIFFIFRFNEDSWIKDSKGVFVRHGNPAITPDDVKGQQNALSCASGLYADFALSNSVLNSSKCLGACGEYAVDLVNVPRKSQDDDSQNQCADFRNGKVNHFIELNNKDGTLVRVF
jgi:hypothetical protein